MMNDYEVLTVDEVLDYLGIGRNSMYGLLKNGDIKAFRIGRKWKIPLKEVDAYIDRSVSELFDSKK